MIAITDTQLRAVLQLPPRPYSDTYVYDGSPYFDLSRREVVTIFSLKGTLGAAAATFVLGVDFALTAGSIDWTLGTRKPDFGTPFVVEYAYSRLGASASSVAIQNAPIIVGHALGSKYPYGTMTSFGVKYDDIALMLQGYLAAREACHSLVAAEIDTAEKYRRGSVLVDDTKKTVDWIAAANEYDAKYKLYLVAARGPVRSFSLANANLSTLVFSSEFARLTGAGVSSDGLYDGAAASADYGGIF